MAPPSDPKDRPGPEGPRDGDPPRDAYPAGIATRSRLVALFVLGLALFNPPLLDGFRVPATILGVPAILLYVFGAWAMVVLLLALAVERRR